MIWLVTAVAVWVLITVVALAFARAADRPVPKQPKGGQ